MKKLKPIVFASLFLLASPLLAQETSLQQGGAAVEAAAQGLPEISPAPAGKPGREKCMSMKMGMGDQMAPGKMGGMEGKMHCKSRHGGEMGGKSCRGGRQACGDSAALERRINELEKRLDLMQQLLQSKSR